MMYAYKLIFLLLCFLTTSLYGQQTQTKDQREKELQQELRNSRYEKHGQYLQDQMNEDSSYDDSHFMQEFVRMLLILAFIVGGMLLVAWIFKRTMSAKMEQVNISSAIKILERRSLTPKTTLYLIEVHGRRIVMGEGQNGIKLLSDIPMTHGSKGGPTFDEVMNQSDK